MLCATRCRPMPQGHATLQRHSLLRSCSVRLHMKHFVGSRSASATRTQRHMCSAMRSDSRLRAYRKPLPHASNDPLYDSSPIVDTTAEEVSTSGQDSDANRDQQHRPNILRRAASAAIGFVSAFYNWLKSNARLKRLLNRYKHLLHMLCLCCCI